MAITWDNADGKWEFYLDSVHRFSIDNFRTGQIVPSNSLIIIGQEQDEFSGGFSPDQALQGSLSRLNIWDTVLPVEVVVSFAKDPGYDNGNVLSWSFLRHHLSDIQASQPSNVVSSGKFVELLAYVTVFIAIRFWKCVLRNNQLTFCDLRINIFR
jgi:hypothetical protein